MFKSLITSSLRFRCLAGLCALCLATSCWRDPLAEQPRVDTEAPSDFFADGASARSLAPGVVPRGQPLNDPARYTGLVDGQPVETFPFPITQPIVQRGQERYNINCALCHGQTGYGDGMIVQRGFRLPPSYHDDRLRNSPVGHFFDVITNGFGAMYDQADRISPDDRWAIIAYIRALQLSQHAPIGLLSPADRASLPNAPIAPSANRLGGGQ